MTQSGTSASPRDACARSRNLLAGADRERAGRRGIALERHVDESLGGISADQRKVKQVLLNLLSNAVKLTPEGGRITVGAGPTVGAVAISVTDTGIDLWPEDHEAVFEEFRQVWKRSPLQRSLRRTLCVDGVLLPLDKQGEQELSTFSGEQCGRVIDHAVPRCRHHNPPGARRPRTKMTSRFRSGA